MMFKRLILLCFFTLSLQYVFAAAQASITTDNDTIEPFQTITLHLVSYNFNPDAIHVDWTINGVPYTGGLGKSSISVKTGDIGVPIFVQATVKTLEGEVVTTGVVLTPESVNIIWDAPESYVPPFYEGKALPGEGSVVRVTALPNMSDRGVQVSPENIAYAWFVNGEAMINGAGIGLQKVNIPLETLTRETEIKVKVQTPKGNTSEKTITITPHAVLPTLYTYDPLYGIHTEKSLIRRFETAKEFTVALVPYFLSYNTKKLKDDSSILWLLDGLPISPEGMLLSLKPRDDTYGSRTITITIEHLTRFLQKATSNLEVVFDTRK